MSAGTVAPRRSAISSPQAGLVLVAAMGAWLGVALWWGDMGAMPGTMGFGLPAFVGMWTVMMAAMMLPATSLVAAMYSRTLATHRTPRMALFTAGYVGVWAAAGLPAYGLAETFGLVAEQTPAAGRWVAAGIFAANGVYQLSPLKDRCLAVCRAPFASILRYASFRGLTRDVRAGVHHGAFCLGCCWLLMVLLAAFGLMNLWAMVGLTAVVTAEKVLPAGTRLVHALGVTSVAAAVLVVFIPELAPGLTGGMAGM